MVALQDMFQSHVQEELTKKEEVLSANDEVEKADSAFDTASAIDEILQQLKTVVNCVFNEVGDVKGDLAEGPG